MKKDVFLSYVIENNPQKAEENSAFMDMIRNFNSMSSFSLISVEGTEYPSDSYHELKRMVRLKRYGMIEIAIVHGKEDKNVARALVIPKMSKRDLISLAQLYSQRVVLSKRMDGIFALKLEKSGPPDVFIENLISFPKDEQNISHLLSHIFSDIHSVYERESISIWREWYITLKEEGDDTKLWKRIA